MGSIVDNVGAEIGEYYRTKDKGVCCAKLTFMQLSTVHSYAVTTILKYRVDINARFDAVERTRNEIKNYANSEIKEKMKSSAAFEDENGEVENGENETNTTTAIIAVIGVVFVLMMGGLAVFVWRRKKKMMKKKKMVVVEDEEVDDEMEEVETVDIEVEIE